MGRPLTDGPIRARKIVELPGSVSAVTMRDTLHGGPSPGVSNEGDVNLLPTM